jgi:hypothetical protein
MGDSIESPIDMIRTTATPNAYHIRYIGLMILVLQIFLICGLYF